MTAVVEMFDRTMDACEDLLDQAENNRKAADVALTTQAKLAAEGHMSDADMSVNEGIIIAELTEQGQLLRETNALLKILIAQNNLALLLAVPRQVEESPTDKPAGEPAEAE